MFSENKDSKNEFSFVLENNTLHPEECLVYEVNLIINKDVYEENKEWLFNHINEMVTLNKFIKADIFEQINLDPIDDSFNRVHKLTAWYYISSYDDLKKYLEQRAKNMRDQVVERFACNYTVTRRVLRLKKEIHSSSLA